MRTFLRPFPDRPRAQLPPWLSATRATSAQATAPALDLPPGTDPCGEAVPTPDSPAAAPSGRPWAADRVRIIPPGASDPPGQVAGRADLTRIRQAGLVAGLAQGGPLGLSFALGGLARARGRPHVKVLGGFGPVVAALLTAPGEQALRSWLGAQATQPRQASLAHDAIPGAILFLATLAWQRLPGPPRPPATSPAGLAATVLVSMAGSMVGGMLSEASAQRSQRGASPQESARVVPALHKGMGRALSLLPLVIWLQAPACLAAAGRPLPRWTGLAGTGVACVGWTFRRLLTPPGPPAAPSTPPNQPG